MAPAAVTTPAPAPYRRPRTRRPRITFPPYTPRLGNEPPETLSLGMALVVDIIYGHHRQAMYAGRRHAEKALWALYEQAQAFTRDARLAEYAASAQWAAEHIGPDSASAAMYRRLAGIVTDDGVTADDVTGPV